MNKKVWILRGAQGSGKSFRAKQLVGDGAIFSTDDFWGESYNFNPTKLREAHLWNQLRALRAMIRGVTPIVIDNTNITRWQMRPYVEDAISCGYEVEIVEPNTPWAFDVEVLVQKNTHNVPRETIINMINSYEHNVTVEMILEKT